MPPPRSHSLEQHNYADQKKQPSNATVIRAEAATGNDAAKPAPAAASSSNTEQESAAKNENLIMGKHSRKLCQA